MENPFTNLYKNKEYGWFAFYIGAVVIASRFGGAVGVIISFLVITGLYKTLKNEGYSTGKKITIATAYVIGGAASFWIVVYLLVFTITQIWGDRALDSVNPQFQEAQSRTLSNETYKDNSTSTFSISYEEEFVDKNLEKTAYVDSKYKFSINKPPSWLVNTSGENATVEFNTPLNNEVALITVNAETNVGYDLQTYSKNVIQGFFSSQGNQNKNLKIISEGNTTLAGKPAYKFETTFDYVNGFETYPFHGYYVVLVDKNIGYVVFVSTFESLWFSYKQIFDASVSSFKVFN